MITDFLRASSVDEAVSLAKEGFVFLAGGTQVNNTPFKKWGKDVEKVVHLESLDLAGIEQDGDDVVVGAMTTLQELADSEVVPAALQKAAWFIPTRSVRNIATIGGNVGANRPDSYVIPAMIALGAAAELADGSNVSVYDYISHGRDDLILTFRMPAICRPHREGAGSIDGSVSTRTAVDVVKESRSHLALPVVSAAVRLSAEGGSGSGGSTRGGSDSGNANGAKSAGTLVVTDAVIAAGCVAPHVIRLSTVESALIAGELGDGSELEDAVARAITPAADILGSTAYKTYVNSAVIADAVRRCLREMKS